MKAFNTYLNFDKNCRQAMEFYAKCLGADLHVTTFAEGTGDAPKPQGADDLVLHARLSKGSLVLMASDCPPGMPLQQGNNFAISVDCESRQEVDTLFAALGENGKPVMPSQDMFWGAYFGMLTDQFGVNWMFNFDTPR